MEKRMTIEEAYEEMQKRGWGFARNNPTGIVAVGPLKNGLVEVYAMDKDPVLAVTKAIERSDVLDKITKEN